MKVAILKATWGMESIPTWEDKLTRIREAGYDGFEHNVWQDLPSEFPALVEKHGLVWVAQLIHNNADDMIANMRRCAPFRPVRFCCHSGRDYYSFEQGCDYFRRVQAEADRLAIPACHETHRYRMLYSPYPTKQYLDALPFLRLNADFSHWTCVTESLLQEIEEIVELASSRALHVHARIGHEEGPQVSDPRAPEFARYRERFEQWWSRMKTLAEQRGDELFTIVPEYGPPAYMPTLPYTRQPVADLWEICLWQADRLREIWGLPKRAA